MMVISNDDRRVSTLVMGAVGDALGAPLEFSRAEAIERQYGTTPPSSLAYHTESSVARVTDDTQMTLFMAEGLLRAIDRGVADERAAFRDEMARSLVHWLATQDRRVFDDIGIDDSQLLTVDALHACRAPGNTCLSSCRHIYRGGELPDLSHRINDSKGCGAVMRSAPFGVMASSAHQAFGWARDAGVLTHCHPSGFLSAAYFAAVLYELVAGQSLHEAMAVADDQLIDEPGSEEVRKAVEEAREVASGGTLGFDAYTSLGEGWVGEEALAMALSVALCADVESPRGIRRALWLSVRHSGDSDSTGAIAGNVLGAMAPVEAWPGDWIESVEFREIIESMWSAAEP